MNLMNSSSNLKYLIVIEKITDEARNKATELNLRILSFAELIEIGSNNLAKPIVSL